MKNTKTVQSTAIHCDSKMLKLVSLFVFFTAKMSKAGEPPKMNVNIVRFDRIKGKGFSKVFTI